MDYDIGSIVMLENVVFKTAYLNNKLTRKVTFDHAKKRPAIIIAEDKENPLLVANPELKNIKIDII